MSVVQLIHTSDDPQSQLAMDEAMLVAADRGLAVPAFRLWAFARPTLVLGRSSRWESEADLEFCRRHEVPVLRRCSGGAAVVGGPGCLMYSVVLNVADRPRLRRIDAAHDHVMARVLNAARTALPDPLAHQADHVRRQGTCDLTWHDRKFSGNSLRIARDHLLYHGTVLVAGDLALLASCLAHAPRQPDYRRGRSHRDFVDNLPLCATRFEANLRDQFGVSHTATPDAPVLDVHRELLRNRYTLESWHRRH